MRRMKAGESARELLRSMIHQYHLFVHFPILSVDLFTSVLRLQVSCFSYHFLMILNIIFMSLSLSYSINLTIIRSSFPKCRLHSYLTFLSTKSLILLQFYTHVFYSICNFILNFNILLILFQYSGSQKTSIPLPNLSNHSNYQYNNPYFHPSSH